MQLAANDTSVPFPFCWRSTFLANRPSTASRRRAIEPLLAELAGYRNVAVRGLMCMAGLEGGLDAARRDFAALRQLRDRLRPNCPPGVTLDELSMGMSGDYEVAIEEGRHDRPRRLGTVRGNRIPNP